MDGSHLQHIELKIQIMFSEKIENRCKILLQILKIGEINYQNSSHLWGNDVVFVIISF